MSEGVVRILRPDGRLEEGQTAPSLGAEEAFDLAGGLESFAPLGGLAALAATDLLPLPPGIAGFALLGFALLGFELLGFALPDRLVVLLGLIVSR